MAKRRGQKCKAAAAGYEDHRRPPATLSSVGRRVGDARTINNTGQRFFRSASRRANEPQVMLEEAIQQAKGYRLSARGNDPQISSQANGTGGEWVTPEQFEAIASPMHALGFNIRIALKRIEIPEPSKVRDRSGDKVASLQNLQLHSALVDDCLEMFKDGHFNEAVRKALAQVEKRIQDIISDTKTIGKQLMGKAFGGATPPIPINAMTTGNDHNEQQGFTLLTMGAMAGLRNLYSHGDADQMAAADAIERFAFVSMLFRRTETATGTNLP